MKKKEKNFLRPPIVVVLGHVDHGKTTILDKIRQTNIQSREAGGITQKIGASQVTTKDKKKITFIDTPGHAAFANMRSQGAKVADIAVLVVAADDGVKPQTIEALDYIKEAKTPFIVALSKIDLPSAQPEKCLSQLEKQKIVFEGKGGNTPYVLVSGKTGKGIDDLLETIILVSEVNGIQGNIASSLQAVVIETAKSKAGPLASVIVRDGSLKVGENILAGGNMAKVRSLVDSQGKSVESVAPGEAIQILGFAKLPPIGSKVEKVEGKKSEAIHPESQKILKKEVREGQIPILLKADTSGSLEAIIASLPEKIMVIASGVGEIGESDILLAKSSNAQVFAFNVKPKLDVVKLAGTEGIKIESFNIIYKLLERLDEIIKGKVEKIAGKAQIIATFPFNNKKIAGCKVIEGVINKTDKLILRSDGKDIGQVKIISMKKQKQDIVQAKPGEEFGILIEPLLDFKVGDMLVSLK